MEPGEYLYNNSIHFASSADDIPCLSHGLTSESCCVSYASLVISKRNHLFKEFVILCFIFSFLFSNSQYPSLLALLTSKFKISNNRQPTYNYSILLYNVPARIIGHHVKSQSQAQR